MMKRKVTVLLGAGFSVNVGLPLASEITKNIFQDYKDRVLGFQDGTWGWAKNRNHTDWNNGRSFDSITYEYILNHVILQYRLEELSENYEELYHFILEKLTNHQWKNKLIEESKKDFLNNYPDMDTDSYLKNFTHHGINKITKILDYLVAELLSLNPISDIKIEIVYKDFVNYILRYDEVDIFTLNHDLLVEKIFEIFQIDYSKGFNTENSPFRSKENINLPYFDNNYRSTIRLYKMHGSIDFFEYKILATKDNVQYHDLKNGQKEYYLATRYQDKLNAEYKSNNPQQNLNIDPIPNFISGVDKKKVIAESRLYRLIYENYEKVIAKTTSLFISGYSYNDSHINELLKRCNCFIINHNLENNYPFENSQIEFIKKFNELRNYL